MDDGGGLTLGGGVGRESNGEERGATVAKQQ